MKCRRTEALRGKFRDNFLGLVHHRISIEEHSHFRVGVGLRLTFGLGVGAVVGDGAVNSPCGVLEVLKVIFLLQNVFDGVLHFLVGFKLPPRHIP